ncbi:hypothetical protein A8L34_19285 [Bacillus sp. FJAT-27264]|uniref:hypothetical protein n=1 Tax=Paenibacillus sp. (strain DSM 101736 / FJAT-27264) TaxID=1850362 RepID=UPI000807EDE1|nr:hypothetical protein [Bacillus sp. FJAT-27264]OBZ10715.1 hypothetical protein A8L34_19285 [Bacillus sp. FJAT-27264]
MVKAKKTVSLLMMVVLTLMLAVPAFAASKSYQFYYGGSYDTHSSRFISGPAEVNGNAVTIKLKGDYFPYLSADSSTYYGSYDASTDLTTFTFTATNPNSDINIQLYVSTVFHSQLYDLAIHWN